MSNILDFIKKRLLGHTVPKGIRAMVAEATNDANRAANRLEDIERIAHQEHVDPLSLLIMEVRGAKLGGDKP